MQEHVCKMYNKVAYDFTYFVVSQCLQHVSNSVHEEQYICTSCDKRLKETSDENPVLPYHAKYSIAVTGANFLKALNMCAHAVIICYFVKLCNSLTLKDYDMSYETVKEYVLKLHRHISHENDDMTTHK